MKINHRIRTLLSVIVMAMVLPLSAQTPQCKDTAEHHRLQAEMWAAATGNDPEKVYLAAVKFQNHADDEGDYEGHYNAWMCGVAFNLDRMNISDAYHIAAVLKEDLETGKGGQEEQYMGPMMMGQVYNVCGNVSGAINELKEAIRLVKGTRYEESTLISLYMALAHLTLTTDPDQSLQWVDEGIQVLNEHQQWSVYQKRLGGAYAMKSIICFKKGDYDNCRFWYDKAMEAHGGEPEGYTGIFMTYAEIYHHAIDGHLQEALKITDSIKSLKERYLIKCDLYQYGGEMDKAFDTQHQLLLLNDSIRGTMMAENISQMEHEKQLMTYQQKMSRLMNIILAITIGLAILAIILLIVGIGYYTLYRVTDASASIEIDQRIGITPTQVKSMKDIGQWEFLSIADEEMIDTTRNGFFTDDQLIRIYYGTLRLGIDMNEVAADWIKKEKDSIVVTLPPIKLLDERFIDEARTKSFFESGKWTDGDRELMYKRAYQRMKDRCMTKENIASAEQNATRQFYQLMRSMGFDQVKVIVNSDGKD